MYLQTAMGQCGAPDCFKGSASLCLVASMPECLMASAQECLMASTPECLMVVAFEYLMASALDCLMASAPLMLITLRMYQHLFCLSESRVFSEITLLKKYFPAQQFILPATATA